jgi:WD40 repeat protein
MTLATEPTEAAAATSQRSPYVGLIPYSETDADYFFGRERDTRVIVANLRGSVLTLLYGASGVGKSSALLAGVLPRLRDRVHAQHDDDDAAVSVAVVRHWRSDPPAELAEALRMSVEEATGRRQPPWDRDAPLIDAVRDWTAHVRTALVVLDQFEEYFLYHPDEYGPGTFADALAQIVNDPALRVHVLISLREDALSQLDHFKATIPGLFTNYLRLDHLDRRSARRAIEGPVEERNRRLPSEESVTIERALVDAVLDQVRAGRLALGEGAAPSEAAGGQQDGDRVETPFLQLVMQRLWTDAMERGARQLTRAALDELGGAERIVSHHLKEALAALGPERERLAAELFAFLVTPSKTKIAQAPSDLAYWTHSPVAEVTSVLRELAVGERRILRSVPPPVGDASGVERYEIFHDVLAGPISEWRAAHEQVREREALAARLEEERDARAVAERRRRRAIGVAVGAFALAAVAVVALIVALHARSTARTQRATAQASALASASFADLNTDPERSLLLAVQAHRARPIPAADEAIRQAIGESRVRTVMRDGTSRPCPTCRIKGVAGAAPATVAIDPSGLVAAPIGSQVVVWDPVGGRSQTFGKADLPASSTVSFSPDGSQIVAGGVETFSVGSSDAGAPPARAVPAVGTAVFSPDGRRLVVGDRGSVAIADVETQRVVRRLHMPTPESGPGIAFGGPRNATLAITTARGVAVWRWPAHGSPAVTLHGQPAIDPRGFARAPVISPDGSKVAWVCRESDACVGSVGSGRLLAVKHDVGDGVLAPLAFTADSRRLLIIGNDTATLMRLGSTPSGKVLSGHLDRILAAALSPDGAMVATASADSTIRVWEAATGQLLTVLRGHEGDVTGVAFSADSQMLASRGNDDTLRLWKVIAGPVLRGATDAVYDARFSPDGRSVVTGGPDGIARLYDMAGAAPRTVAVAPGGVFAVAFSRQGQVLAAGATAYGGGFLAVKDPATGRGMVARTASTGPYFSATFLPDGRIVTGDLNGTVRLWSTSGGRLRPGQRLMGPGSGPTDRAISLRAKGDLIAIALGNGTVHLFRQDGTPVRVLRAASGGDEVVYAASFSPDGRRLVTAGAAQPIRVWSVADGKPQVTITSVPGTTYSADFSPDGRRLVTGGADGDVRLWDAATGRPLAALHEHSAVVDSVSFAPDGRTILSASDDRTARIYPCEPCEPVGKLLSLARARTSRDLTAAELRRYADGR